MLLSFVLANLPANKHLEVPCFSIHLILLKSNITIRVEQRGKEREMEMKMSAGLL